MDLSLIHISTTFLSVTPMSNESSAYGVLEPAVEEGTTYYTDSKIPYILRIRIGDTPFVINSAGNYVDFGVAATNDGDRYGDTFSALLDSRLVKELESTHSPLPVQSAETAGGRSPGKFQLWDPCAYRCLSI